MENARKTCIRCLESKTVDSFGMCNRNKDKLQNICKPCLKFRELESGKNRPLIIRPDFGLKVCGKCKEEKDINLFSNNPKCSLGVHSMCKQCAIDKASKWAKDFPQKMRNNGKKYRDGTPEKQQAKYRAYKKKQDILNPKPKRADLTHHKDDQRYHLRIKTRALIKQCFSRACEGKFSKAAKTEKILGCTMTEFIVATEINFCNWMNWKNYGKSASGVENSHWSLDHIIPISFAKTEDEINLLNHWSNLVPICHIENIRKSNKIYPLTNIELMITINEDFELVYLNKSA